VCIPGQRRSTRVATVTVMTFADMKIAVVIAWALIWSVIAVSLVSSVGNWILLVGSGVLPPIVMLRIWSSPARPVPARIRKAPG
jgi:fatty acid desaturase